jgi:hypothetical protein
VCHCLAVSPFCLFSLNDILYRLEFEQIFHDG